MNTTIKLKGAPQSPYSRKMRSALRYKRIPFQWIRLGSPEAQGHPKTKIKGMIPVLWFNHHNNEKDYAILDSSFQLQKLEEDFPNRCFYHKDPGVNFFSSNFSIRFSNSDNSLLLNLFY